MANLRKRKEHGYSGELLPKREDKKSKDKIAASNASRQGKADKRVYQRKALLEETNKALDVLGQAEASKREIPPPT